MTARLPAVVAGVDGTRGDRHVALAAADDAHRELRPLVLVTAVEQAPDAGRAHHGPWSRALAHLDALRRDLATRVPALPVRTVVRDGPPARVLRDEAAGTATTVVGTGGGPDGLGPVTRALVTTSDCPVSVVVPPGVPGGPVVVAGVDGTAGTTAVLAAAALQAGTRGTSLHVVHACRADGLRQGVDGVLAEPWAPVAAAVTAAGRRLVEAHVARARDGWPGIPVSVDVRAGDPARVLVDRCLDAGLLVVGRPRSAAGTALVEAVTTRARCPVLVVPPAPPDRRRAARRPAGIALPR
ncbi:universal stress protein [Geodermatophilus sp. SYSU D00696]